MAHPGPIAGTVKFRVDGKSRSTLASTNVAVETLCALDNIRDVYGRSRSECVEQALRFWLMQFPEEEKLFGLKHVRSKARRFDAFVCSDDEDEEVLNVKDIVEGLKVCGYECFLDFDEVIDVTGYSADEVLAFIEPFDEPPGSDNKSGTVRYQRAEVARHVDPKLLVR